MNLTISASGSRQQVIEQLTRLQQSSEADGLGGAGGKLIGVLLEHVNATPAESSSFSIACSINVSYSKVTQPEPPKPAAPAPAKPNA